MNIPGTINVRNTFHGSGANGMAIYGYEDTAGLGIRMEARRKDRRSPFIETWFLDALPNREFPTFAALREAALPLTDEQIVAQTSALYPLIKVIEPDKCGNPCRLCPRPESRTDADGKRIIFDTWRVSLANSWKDSTECSLCDVHVEQFEKDPKGLKAALDEEVRQRKERAARRMSEGAA